MTAYKLLIVNLIVYPDVTHQSGESEVVKPFPSEMAASVVGRSFMK